MLEMFTFSAKYGYRITNGEVGELVRDVVLSGNVFDTLNKMDGFADDLNDNPSVQTVPGTCAGLPDRPLYENKGSVSGVTLDGEQVANIGSQDMNDAVWLKLARRINEIGKEGKIDGIVITHGTDTYEETAYFLNLFAKTDMPIVLVGSMRPSTATAAPNWSLASNVPPSEASSFASSVHVEPLKWKTYAAPALVPRSSSR